MEKYIIKIIKPETIKDDSPMGRMIDRGGNYDRQIFQAEMDSDATIEILQHLYNLKDRKIVV